MDEDSILPPPFTVFYFLHKSLCSLFKVFQRSALKCSQLRWPCWPGAVSEAVAHPHFSMHTLWVSLPVFLDTVRAGGYPENKWLQIGEGGGVRGGTDNATHTTQVGCKCVGCREDVYVWERARGAAQVPWQGQAFGAGQGQERQGAGTTRRARASPKTTREDPQIPPNYTAIASTQRAGQGKGHRSAQ